MGTIVVGLVYVVAVGYLVWVEPGAGIGLAARGQDVNLFKMTSKELHTSKYYKELKQ